jgi:hypothetical protein
LFIETSAKDGTNIDELFELLGRKVMAKLGNSKGVKGDK